MSDERATSDLDSALSERTVAVGGDRGTPRTSAAIAADLEWWAATMGANTAWQKGTQRLLLEAAAALRVAGGGAVPAPAGWEAERAGLLRRLETIKAALDRKMDLAVEAELALRHATFEEWKAQFLKSVPRAVPADPQQASPTQIVSPIVSNPTEE